MKCRRYSLLVIYVQGLGGAQPFIVGIDDGNRAVEGTGTAGGTPVLIHITRMAADFGGKVTYVACNGKKLSFGDDLDIWRPTGLDQLRRQNSDGAIVGGKRFVQLGHDAPNGGAFFNHIYVVTQISQV